MITIGGGNEPWGYVDLLNECIKILVTVALGIALAYWKVFDSTVFVPQTIKFVFRVALPFHIMRGIGINVDWYNPRFQWNFIVAFLVLRAVALVASVVWVMSSALCKDKDTGIGQVAVLWLLLTWVSSVIIGVPISTAVFGAELGLFYGLLAGISSFIFQLPVQLFFLECHVLEEEMVRSRQQESADERDVDEEAAAQEKELSSSEEIDLDADASPNEKLNGLGLSDEGDTALDRRTTQNGQVEPAQEVTSSIPSQSSRLLLWLQLSGATRRDVTKRVMWGVITNPVIWGIVAGFILSLSTVGPRFLKPTSTDYIPGLGWINDTLTWFGNMVSPLSLFAMGVWMQNQGRDLFKIPIHSAVLSMVSKLFLVPLLMVGLAKAMNLSDNSGRAAVLIASLPISMAAFSLGSHYKIGEALLSENIALGTALMLPTVLLWNLVMDSIGLFPTTPVPAVVSG